MLIRVDVEQSDVAEVEQVVDGTGRRTGSFEGGLFVRTQWVNELFLQLKEKSV